MTNVKDLSWSVTALPSWQRLNRRATAAVVGPIPGLYAAGETTGHFYGSAPNAVSVLRALVFGEIADRQAVDFLAQE
jgi:succinate dehydrogenase/fumarate reductase flavoprotein subunit